RSRNHRRESGAPRVGGGRPEVDRCRNPRRVPLDALPPGRDRCTDGNRAKPQQPTYIRNAVSTRSRHWGFVSTRREKCCLALFDVSNARVHRVNIRAEYEKLAPPVSHSRRILGTPAEDPPRLSRRLARQGDGFDCPQAPGILKFTRHAEN